MFHKVVFEAGSGSKQRRKVDLTGADLGDTAIRGAVFDVTERKTLGVGGKIGLDGLVARLDVLGVGPRVSLLDDKQRPAFEREA